MRYGDGRQKHPYAKRINDALEQIRQLCPDEGTYYDRVEVARKRFQATSMSFADALDYELIELRKEQNEAK